MPIKPENRHRYPENWKEIREAVLERAGNRCELCGAKNHTFIRRFTGAPAIWKLAGSVEPGMDDMFGQPIKVILTVAHLDPTYSSHDKKHLLALCQRCHLKIDAHVRDAGRRKASK